MAALARHATPRIAAPRLLFLYPRCAQHRLLGSLPSGIQPRGTPQPHVDSPSVVRPVEGAPHSTSPSSTQTSDPASQRRLLESAQPGPPPPAPKVERPRPRLRASKAAVTLTPAAVERIRALLAGPNPQYLRVGVKNKGCAGMSYHLEYVEKPGKFDEIVEQDGVKVLIDSKALFSIIGSEMDWVEDKLSSKFEFMNPNIKDACGCGESFNV